MVRYSQIVTISDNIILLFKKEIYEPLICNLMNISTKVFPEQYIHITSQAKGECDFISSISESKFDAKLPFLSHQIELLTNGKKHAPKIREWLEDMQNECAEFDPQRIRDDPNYSIQSTRLYCVMKDAILRDKPDESIVFFVPFPVVPSIPQAVLLNLASDFLTKIFDTLKLECELYNRNIYAIYPSLEKNVLALRNLNTRSAEYIRCNELQYYISYEVNEVLNN